jgi:hypothetical protein
MSEGELTGDPFAFETWWERCTAKKSVQVVEQESKVALTEWVLPN